MLVYLDREYVDAAEAKVPAGGGHLYGDGVFTTLRIYDGSATDLAGHLERLQQHGARLQLSLPEQWEELPNIVSGLIRRNGLERRDGRLRITISRGSDPGRPLPLDRLHLLRSTLLVTAGPLPEFLSAWQSAGIAVVTLDGRFLRGNFPDLKTLNNLPSVLALRAAAARNCPEALIVDHSDSVREAAVSNLFVIRENNLLTPPADGTLLAGRTRSRILELGPAAGLICSETRLTLADLAEADEIFLTNSIREVVPVVTVDDRPVAGGDPGPVTSELQRRYREHLLGRIAP